MVGILSRKGIRRGGGSPLNFCWTLLHSLFLNPAAHTKTSGEWLVASSAARGRTCPFLSTGFFGLAIRRAKENYVT
jgi:hypothetical protein